MEVVKLFWKVGRFRAEDISIIYSSNESRVECLKILLMLGIIIEDPQTNSFIIDRDRCLELE
jgi:hypothetical protein